MLQNTPIFDLPTTGTSKRMIIWFEIANGGAFFMYQEQGSCPNVILPMFWWYTH